MNRALPPVMRIGTFKDLDVWQVSMDLVDLGHHDEPAVATRGILIAVAFRNGFLDRESCRQLVETNTRVGNMLNRLHDALDD